MAYRQIIVQVHEISQKTGWRGLTSGWTIPSSEFEGRFPEEVCPHITCGGSVMENEFGQTLELVEQRHRRIQDASRRRTKHFFTIYFTCLIVGGLYLYFFHWR